MPRHLVIALGLAVIGFLNFGCQTFAPAAPVVATPSRPNVVITSPPGGSIYTVGQSVAVQSSSTDPAGIVRVTLIVDGVTVHEDASPVATGQQQYSLVQDWVADKVGQHNVIVRATNAQGVTTDTGIYVAVQQGAASAPTATMALAAAAVTPTNALASGGAAVASSAATPSSTATATGAAAACIENAAFVADLTVPDGMNFSPGTTFSKSWRVLNNGTCFWQNYVLAFTNNTQMAPAAAYPVPSTAAGSTVDLAVPMTAPAASGIYTGTWQIRDSGGTLFGTLLTVSITVGPAAGAAINTATPNAGPTNTPAPAPTLAGSANCSGQPGNFTFTASKTSITSGQSVTLNWGAVNNASIAVLNGGSFNNQGVAAPGSISDSPAATTTYTLTATCSNGGGTRLNSVTVTVAGSAACSNPAIGSFTGAPANITDGQGFTLTWSGVNGADSITILGPAGTLHENDSSGSVTVYPTKSWTYVMTASCSVTGQSASKSFSVNVTPVACAGVPSNFTFTATKTTIKAGQSLTLSWSGISNADAVRLFDSPSHFFSEGFSGSRVVDPASTTTYTLNAYCNASSSVRSQQITVTVNP